MWLCDNKPPAPSRYQGAGSSPLALTVGAATLALAVVTVVVSGDEGRLDVSRVGDGLAQAVSSERHDGDEIVIEVRN
jgi:hypothetical protein